MLKTEIEQVEHPIMESVLFTKINVEMFGKAKASDGLKILDFAASEYGLNIKHNRHFKTSKRALINQIKNN
jgi:hypothetical protein